MFSRVNGDLAVSRAFGDFIFKSSENLPPSQQQVTVEPEISILEINDDDRFVILACDGIWDVISTQDACDFISTRLKGGYTLGETCEALVYRCLHHGSKDNMSIILLRLKTIA